MSIDDRGPIDDALERWARMSDTPAPKPPARTSRDPGRLVTLAILVVVGVIGLRAWQSAGLGAGASPEPSSGGAVVSASPSASPPPKEPTPAPSATASGTASPGSEDSSTARSIATRYETARASGDFGTAWSMLSAFSQSVIGSLAEYEQIEKAYNASGGTTFQIQDPTRNPDLLAPEFLGQELYLDVQAKADINRAWLVFVVHPDVRGASAGTTGLLVAPTGDHWSVWIVH